MGDPVTETSIVPLASEDATWDLAEMMPTAIAPMPEAFVSVAAAIETLAGFPLWAEPPQPAGRSRKGLLVYELPMQGKPIGLTVHCVKALALARGNLEVSIPRHPTRGPWADIQISEDGQETSYVEVPAVVASARVRDTLNNVSFEAEAVEEMIRRNKETGKLSKLEQADRSAQSKAIRDACRPHMAAIESQLKQHLLAEMRAGHEYVTGEVDPKWLQAETHREVVLETRKHRGEESIGAIQAALLAKAVTAVEKAAGLRSGALMTEYQAFIAGTWPGTRNVKDLPESQAAALNGWLRRKCGMLKVDFPEDVLRPPQDQPPTEDIDATPPAEPEATPEPDAAPAQAEAPPGNEPTAAGALLIAFDEVCASKDWAKAKIDALYRTAGLDPKKRAAFTEEEATRLFETARKVAANGNEAPAQDGKLDV